MAMLQGYCDASFGGNSTDRNSTSRNLFFYHGRPVFWESKKLALMAMSTAESEYIAMALAAQNLQVFKTVCVESVHLANDACHLKTDNQAFVPCWPSRRAQNAEYSLV